MDPNIWTHSNVSHILWRNQDKLFSNWRPCRFNLTCQICKWRIDTIIAILVFRFTASMKTSLKSAKNIQRKVYNSSRARIGDPIASQTESNIQTWVKDFSPPESDLGSFLVPFSEPAGFTVTRISWFSWSMINLPRYPRWVSKWWNICFALALMDDRNLK